MHLARLITQNASVIYVDETTFNFHQRNSRTWSYSDERVQLPVSNTRHSGVTLYGAIGECLKHPVFTTGESTNAIDFTKFLRDVVASFRNEADRPHLVIDNHSAHHSKLIDNLLRDHFTVTYLPTYSCQFNSIETLWSVIKKQFRKQVGIRVRQITQQCHLNQLVLDVAVRIPQRLVNNICRANRSYLLNQLLSIKRGDRTLIEH